MRLQRPALRDRRARARLDAGDRRAREPPLAAEPRHVGGPGVARGGELPLGGARLGDEPVEPLLPLAEADPEREQRAAGAAQLLEHGAVAARHRAEAVQPRHRRVDRLGAEHDRDRVDLPLLVERPEPLAEPPLGDAQVAPGELEPEGHVGALAAYRGGAAPDRRELGAGAGELRLERVELEYRGARLRRERGVALAERLGALRGSAGADGRRSGDDRESDEHEPREPRPHVMCLP